MAARISIIPALQYASQRNSIVPLASLYGDNCKDPEGHVWTFGTYDPMAH